VVTGKAKVSLIAAGLVGCVGCSRHNPGPEPRQVQPGSALQGEVTPVRILGRGFRPRLRANLDDEQSARVESDFSATLGGTPLVEVTFVSSGELGARVPGSVPAGTHPLTVIDPDGLRGMLENAFTVVGPGGQDAGHPDGPPPDGTRPPDGSSDGPSLDGPLSDGPPADTQPDLAPKPDIRKSLGVLCFWDFECASNHCVVSAKSKFVKICCAQTCWGKDGCSQDGLKCED
jgi:hypothetical protein